jgi:hypothetical protein
MSQFPRGGWKKRPRSWRGRKSWAAVRDSGLGDAAPALRESRGSAATRKSPPVTDDMEVETCPRFLLARSPSAGLRKLGRSAGSGCEFGIAPLRVC